MIQIRRIKGSQNVHERKRWTQKTTLKEQKNLNPNVTYDTNKNKPQNGFKNTWIPKYLLGSLFVSKTPWNSNNQ